jgi:hypothetical protein
MTLDQFSHICSSIVPDEKGCMNFPRPHGQVYITRNHLTENRTMTAARLALSRHLGRPIQPGMFVCHTCDNPPCVNPDHLYEGTHTDKLRDMQKRGRQEYHPPRVKKIAP